MRGISKIIPGLIGTLKGYVFSSMVGIAFLVFLGTTIAASLLYEKLLEERSLATSLEISQQNINAIQQVLRTGGLSEQMQEAIAASKSIFSTTVNRIDIYRSTGVTTLYGRADKVPSSGIELEVLSSGKPSFNKAGDHVRYTQPIIAESECLGCHFNLNEGDVMGVIDIRHNVQQLTATVRMYYIALFIAFGTLVFLTALALTKFVTRRLNRSVRLFRSQVEAFTTIRDFESLEIDKVDFGFREFNQAFDNVTLLVEKIRCVAVDKDVLEFENRLLEKFIITSNVVRDWREFVHNLLLEIKPIIGAYALVTVFRVEEDVFECEVFWRKRPCDSSADLLQKIIRRQLQEHGLLDGTQLLHMIHNIADEEGTLPDLNPEDVEAQTKMMFLDTPRIGGIVGIGVQSMVEKDNVLHTSVDSILMTLLNLIGSVKAINKYTKDLEHYATRDPLTDLYNQRMFWELLGYEVGRSKRHGEKFAVMMLDLDNFKTINDRFGHHFGDVFLQAFAKLLQAAIRNGDLLARYGGDEFCIILPDASEIQAHMIAQRIAEMLENHSLDTPDGIRLKATTSIGIAISPDHGDNPKDLFLVADNMMYKAKNAGKNAIAIPNEDEMAEVFRKAGDKSLMIQNALDQQRIIPYFQPICDTCSGKIEIHELLMRIQLDDAILSAGDFIEEAENMGIAHKMDYQLIEKAFAQVKAQSYQGMLFVNLSPKALIVGEFASRVSLLAERFGIEPKRIVFEITERETVRNLSLLEEFVLDVKMKGFSFAIDDFGSGYSSFHYIKRFPVDFIKIEGEFIRNMLQDDTYLAFVKSIVTLAKELNIKTVAEFVEDAEILAAVGRLGIDYAQGYHISRPSPIFHIPVEGTNTADELCIA